MVEPVIEDLAAGYGEQLKVAKLHVDRNPRTRDRYHVLGVPTFALFIKGEIVCRRTGAQSKKQLEQMLAEAFEAL
jgi:thioredoxin 1